MSVTELFLERDAVLSDCGTYRYLLRRTWDHGKPRALVVMLNPSTADAEVDDATIRSLVRLLRDSYGSFEVVNVFAFRSTDPKRLTEPADPVGPRNQPIIEAAKPCLVLQRDALESLGVKDWQDTADIIGGLDLVVTVDTAIAHLAASLGVRVMMLSRFDRCWRWPARGKTVWYPSMIIYGQHRLGHWAPVIEAVVTAIGVRN